MSILDSVTGEEVETGNNIIPLPDTIQTDIENRLLDALDDGDMYVSQLTSHIQGQVESHMKRLPIGSFRDEEFRKMASPILFNFIISVIEKAYVGEGLPNGSIKFTNLEIIEIENLYAFLMSTPGQKKLIDYLRKVTIEGEETTLEDKFYDYLDVVRSIIITYYSNEKLRLENVIKLAEEKMNSDHIYGGDQIRWSKIIYDLKAIVSDYERIIDKLSKDREGTINAILVSI